MTRACERCGAEFQVRPGSAGRPQRFCSRDCSVHSSVCELCGKAIRPEHRRCFDCLRSQAERKRRERWQTIADLLEQGCSHELIARRFGWAPQTVGKEISVMRAAGWSIPYVRDSWITRSRKPSSRPETKQGARNRLNRAIRTGEIVRPDACEHCGAEGHVEGHHHDYSKPFDVEWLCRTCHAAHHSAEREEAA